jgi:hypothetical protein
MSIQNLKSLLEILKNKQGSLSKLSWDIYPIISESPCKCEWIDFFTYIYGETFDLEETDIKISQIDKYYEKESVQAASDGIIYINKGLLIL